MILSRPWSALLSSSLYWLLISLLVGLVANRLPRQWLEWVPEGHPRSRGKIVRKVMGIRAWKRWIPDAGAALPGGVAKAQLVKRDPAILERLLIEIRRAELVHGLLWPAGLVTVLWLPRAGLLGNLLFATLFNLPCLLLQRFNRRRVQSCLARMKRTR
ncbi:MAG: hypothetical protein VKK98_01735 [Cyanobacteriota bacterium]|nr:hypothetical protein [Cyanobacteriota bacterium]